MMALRHLVAMAIFWPVIWRAQGDVPHPCFSSEAVPSNERRFFSFAPANVRSNPPVDCVFVFGGPPGSLLRLGLYDVRTKGPKVFRGQESANLCSGDVIRVYDLGRQGLQLRGAFCGLLRRSKMLSMSSNMAIVTYTSDSNDLGNAFNLGVDAVHVGRDITTRGTTQPPCAATTATPEVPTTVPTSTAGDPEEAEIANLAPGDRFGDWGGASGDSESEEDQSEVWYHDNSGGVVSVISTVAGGMVTTPEPPGDAAERVEGRQGTGVEDYESEGALTTSWGTQDGGGLDGEDSGKVVSVHSNGTGDEDDDAIAFYYYL